MARAAPEHPPSAAAALDVRRRLHAVEEAGLTRHPPCLDGPQGPEVRIDGRPYLNFCSNDYLSLAADPRLARALAAGAARFGAGAGASQLVCGRSAVHVELEQALAAFLRRDRALVFSSGYLANLAVAGALLEGRADLVAGDRLNHASLIDAALLSRARLRRYPHGDADALARILAPATGRKLVLTDGVFSMDGDMAPLAALAAVCREAGAVLVVDDAHGIGVLGACGAGALAQAGLDQDAVPLVMGTFGKALGAAGAFVAGAAPLLELILQRARSYMFTTALAPPLAAAALAALAVVRDEPQRRARLWDQIHRFRAGAAARGLSIGNSDSAIHSLVVGAPAAAVALSAALRDAGILVTPIRPPTVPAHTARLRITLNADHSAGQVDGLLDALAACRPRP